MFPARVAIKQLTSSDLSFFEGHLRDSRQKAINLNADVFVTKFFPGLAGGSPAIPMPTIIHGPAGGASYPLMRKIVHSPGSKNWRLNGEIVHAPEGEPDRFRNLAEGDFVVLAFDGSPIPLGLTLVLISAADDGALHAAIRSRLDFAGNRTMVVAYPADLDVLLDETQAQHAGVHPLDSLRLPDTVEEVLFGSAAQGRVARADGRGATLSPEALERQLRAAEQTGREGEEAFNRWLESAGHEEADFEWVSRTHARAAFDFHVRRPKWATADGEVFVDVKATRADVGTPIHLSIAEVRWAASHPNYRIARVHGLGEDEPKVSMLRGVHELSTRILASLDALPPGVTIDSFAVRTTDLTEELTEDVPPLE